MEGDIHCTVHSVWKMMLTVQCTLEGDAHCAVHSVVDLAAIKLF